jgi:hypothetical protein
MADVSLELLQGMVQQLLSGQRETNQRLERLERLHVSVHQSVTNIGQEISNLHADYGDMLGWRRDNGGRIERIEARLSALEARLEP